MATELKELCGLKKEYVPVQEEHRISYGGNQSWFSQKHLADYGCGLVGMGDLLLYLYRNGSIAEIPMKKVLKTDKSIKLDNNLKLNKFLKSNKFFKLNKSYGERAISTLLRAEIISKECYLEYLDYLNRHWFPISRILRGTTGLHLWIGLELVIARLQYPYRARWGVATKNLYRCITHMLREEIPVVFSVGMNFPWIWRTKGVELWSYNSRTYTMNSCGNVLKHYMVITGIVENEQKQKLLRVSSWGKEYYVYWDEFENYMRRKSLPLFTNILYIWKKI